MTPTTRAFVVAPTPVTLAGLRSMLTGVEGTDVRVIGEAGPSAAPDPSAFSEADVVLLADEELLEETAIALAEDGTQALVLISDDDHAIPRLRALGTLRRRSTQTLLLAHCERVSGDPGFIRTMEEAVRINPRLWNVHKLLADHYRRRGDRERAEYHRTRAMP